MSDEFILDRDEILETAHGIRMNLETLCKDLPEEDKRTAILESLHEQLFFAGSQYTEFAAFIKTLDLSLSKFRQLPSDKRTNILPTIVEEYCKRRFARYEDIGYSDTTLQTMYDSGSSRKKGHYGKEKIKSMLRERMGFGTATDITAFNQSKKCMIDIDSETELFWSILRTRNVMFEFSVRKEGKIPDMLVKVGEHLLLIEAKHVHEGGGAQNKQINELIEFVSYSEDPSLNCHYVSFLDGQYANILFDRVDVGGRRKIDAQRSNSLNTLEENPSNFFVNTAGLLRLVEDMLSETSG